jgi:hypothetical protein
MTNSYYGYIRYEKYLYEDDTFTAIKYRDSYLCIPNKIIRSNHLASKEMLVHTKIFISILDKVTESQNNLYQIYF